MSFGAFIIGDEILRGRKQDRHLAKLIELLRARGLHLAWTMYLGDDPPRLIEAFQRSFARADIVFSFGGIGATPDDHTRACVAQALGLELSLHPEAAPLIEAAIQRRSGKPANAQQLQMGFFPRGAAIIPNSFNGIPGFSFDDHHFVPGFPEMAWPMVEWVLDQCYANLHHREPEGEDAVYIYEAMESTLTPLMVDIEARYGGLKIFSLPHVGGGGVRRHVELGVRGDPDQVPLAMAQIRAAVAALGAEYSVEPPIKNPA